MIKTVCVFCGSSPGARPEYAQAARQLAHTLVEREIGLVYGGGSVGLMGAIATTVLAAGGKVTGVIPAALLEKEVALTELPDLRVVDSMHERKALMAEICDAFISLPGGFGTTEELIEALTWAQLGIHGKPCGILNVLNYFDHLIDFLDRAVVDGFLRPEHRAMICIADDPNNLLAQFEAYEPPRIDKAEWILTINEA